MMRVGKPLISPPRPCPALSAKDFATCQAQKSSKNLWLLHVVETRLIWLQDNSWPGHSNKNTSKYNEKDYTLKLHPLNFPGGNNLYRLHLQATPQSLDWSKIAELDWRRWRSVLLDLHVPWPTREVHNFLHLQGPRSRSCWEGSRSHRQFHHSRWEIRWAQVCWCIHHPPVTSDPFQRDFKG